MPPAEAAIVQCHGYTGTRRIHLQDFARAGQPKKLVVIKGFSHYACYSGDALRLIIDAALDWYGGYMPMQENIRKR